MTQSIKAKRLRFGFPRLGGVLSLAQPKEGIYQCIGRNLYGVAQVSTVLILPNSSQVEGKSSFLRSFDRSIDH